MVIEITNAEGRQIMPMMDATLDMEVNDGERDFALTFSRSQYDERIGYDSRIFVDGTEFGGILGELATSTSTDTITWLGYTWRGLMAKKLILPPDGADYYTVNDELNNILRDLIEPMFDGVFVVPEIDTGVTVSWKFDRFCTLLDGLTKMLKSVGYRLNIAYNQGEPNGVGWVEVTAVPIVDWSGQIELSEDSQLHFSMSDKRNGVNHLVIGGKGELQDRNITHLYVQKDGSIGKTQYYTGIHEIVEFYENTSTETEDVESKGEEHLKEVMNVKTFDMDIESLGIDIPIGDIVGGRDYITGMYASVPIGNIIVKVENGIISKEYRLEGS